MIGRLLELFRLRPFTPHERAEDRRQPWGKGSGRASYAVVQRHRRRNKTARRSRRINRAGR